MADHVQSAAPDEGFLQRWARRKEEAARAGTSSEPATQASTDTHIGSEASPAREGAPAAALDAAPLTSDDVAALAADANYAPFMAQGVDKSVQRLAMKKLFSDPHFQVLDGLDIYMGDYNVASPVSAGMLANLQHAQGMLARGAELAERLLESERTRLLASNPATSASSHTTSDATATVIATSPSQSDPEHVHANAIGGAPVPPPITEGDA